MLTTSVLSWVVGLMETMAGEVVVLPKEVMWTRPSLLLKARPLGF